MTLAWSTRNLLVPAFQLRHVVPFACWDHLSTVWSFRWHLCSPWSAPCKLISPVKVCRKDANSAVIGLAIYSCADRSLLGEGLECFNLQKLFNLFFASCRSSFAAVSDVINSMNSSEPLLCCSVASATELSKSLIPSLRDDMSPSRADMPALASSNTALTSDRDHSELFFFCSAESNSLVQYWFLSSSLCCSFSRVAVSSSMSKCDEVKLRPQTPNGSLPYDVVFDLQLNEAAIIGQYFWTVSANHRHSVPVRFQNGFEALQCEFSVFSNTVRLLRRPPYQSAGAALFSFTLSFVSARSFTFYVCQLIWQLPFSCCLLFNRWCKGFQLAWVSDHQLLRLCGWHWFCCLCLCHRFASSVQHALQDSNEHAELGAPSLWERKARISRLPPLFTSCALANSIWASWASWVCRNAAGFPFLMAAFALSIAAMFLLSSACWTVNSAASFSWRAVVSAAAA